MARSVRGRRLLLGPLKPDQVSPDGEPSLFYDDKAIMDTRFERLRHPNIHAQTPAHRTCHLVGNVTIQSIDETCRECTVVSSMIMTDYRVRTQRLFSGRVEHHLRHDGTATRLSSSGRPDQLRRRLRADRGADLAISEAAQRGNHMQVSRVNGL